MKKLLKILLAIAGVIVLAIVAVFLFTAGLVTSADEFFLAVKNKDLDKAYGYLSEDFQAGTSKAELEAFLSKNALGKFREANWGARSISGGRGSLAGSISTESGGVVPISLSFVKGDNGWRIYSIEKPSSGIQEESASRQIPGELEQVKLVADSTLVFAQSVNDKSMAKFYQHLSNLWQQQTNVEELDNIFRSFYALESDLTVLKNYSPVFAAPTRVNENGVLIISGHYPTKPSQVTFEHKYIYEGLNWKLIGFSSHVK